MLEVGLHSIFLSSKSKGPEILAQAAHGNFRVIFLCVEMVEGPSFTQVLRATSSAIGRSSDGISMKSVLLHRSSRVACTEIGDELAVLELTASRSSRSSRRAELSLERR